jgi:hypothetical protein
MCDLTRFSMYPIGRIARGAYAGGDEFDLSLLPIEVLRDVHIEDVSSLIRMGDFDIHKSNVGEYRFRELERIKYAIIHRYPQNGPDPDTGRYLVDTDQTERSRKLVSDITACLRIIRPITTRAQFCEGKVSDDGQLYDIAFNEPVPEFSLPENQSRFGLRNVDTEELRFYAPRFINAMNQPFWKFRMAVQMYNTGYFEHEDWKMRFFLWTSALEALFTSQNSDRQHSGSLVAKERIKDHLGASSLLYPHGELLSLEPIPTLQISDVIDEIYCLRNHIAHGDKVPDYYFQETGRENLNGDLNRVHMLTEAISFIVRRSLLKILKDDLLKHFQDGASSEAYFSARDLTKNAIKKSVKKAPFICPA